MARRRERLHRSVQSTKTLMSASKIASKGNRVVFDDDGSYIERKTSGEKSWLKQSGGMYYLKMWVSRKSSAEACF